MGWASASNAPSSIRRLTGRARLPVAEYAPNAVKKAIVGAGNVDAISSLLRNSSAQIREETLDLIIDTVKQNPNEVTLVAVGPLTNLALAARLAPEIVPLVRMVVTMGGSFNENDTEPEFNAHCDPEAAHGRDLVVEVVLEALLPQHALEGVGIGDEAFLEATQVLGAFRDLDVLAAHRSGA